MPRIFDNIDRSLLPALRKTLALSQRADFCVGYFNLRGWKALDEWIDRWAGGPGQCCRLLVGRQRLPQDYLNAALSVFRDGNDIDNQTAIRLKKKLAEDFRGQLVVGVPTNEDYVSLYSAPIVATTNELTLPHSRMLWRQKCRTTRKEKRDGSGAACCISPYHAARGSLKLYELP